MSGRCGLASDGKAVGPRLACLCLKIRGDPVRTGSLTADQEVENFAWFLIETLDVSGLLNFCKRVVVLTFKWIG
jgi:hypothetical protein